MALTPSFSTGGMPRPSKGSVGTSVSSLLKTKMPSLNRGSGIKGTALKGVTFPKAGSMKAGPKLSTKTLSGGTVKAPKTTIKPSSLSSSLKSLISAAKKSPSPMGGAGLGMSSGVGAPAATPSPAFFGQPNAGPGGIGLGM